MKGLQQPRQQFHASNLPTADGDLSLYKLIQMAQFFLRLIHQRENFPRPAAQQHALRGQGDAPGAAVKQLYAHLLFHLRNLTAECGLRDVQHLRRAADAFLAHHGQEIAQHTDLHALPSPENNIC